VAVVTREGQTAMAVNPAAPAFLEQRQFNLSLGYGEAEETGGDAYDLELTDRPEFWGGGLEGYVPLSRVTLFGGAGHVSESIDWQQVYPGEGVVLWGDGDERSTAINLGVAGALHEMVALGGQLLTLRRSLNEDGRGVSYDVSDTFLSGEFGLLVATPAQVNFGLTWRWEDGNDEALFSREASGINETLKAGAAWQQGDGRWLVGVEYVDRKPLSLGDPVFWSSREFEEEVVFGEERVHLYGEYRFERLSIRAGVCRSSTDEAVPIYDHATGGFSDYEFDVDHLVFSGGLSGRFSGRLGWDAYLQWATGDSRCRFETYDGPVYDYEDEALRLGFGVTWRFGGAGD
jgi:hypothetical protein